MKIVIDLQGLQTQSHRRGIGRCTRDHVHAFLDCAAGRHQVHLALSSPLEETTDAVLAEFRQRVPADRIHYLRLPFGTSEYLPGNEWRRAAAARLMRLQLDALQADWVWHTSVFEGYDEDAVVPDAALAHAATAATLYDLIPLHEPEALLSNARARRWYEANLSVVRRADLLLSISDYTRADAIERLGLRPEQVVTIGCIVDPRFAPPAPHSPAELRVRERFGLRSRFVLYSGGFDARKNVGTLIASYAALPAALRVDCPLVLAGHIREEHRHQVRELAAGAGLRDDELIVTGSLTDEDLIALYGSCALFVFPSRFEGFGLPPAEAMACGAPTLASRATSVPEVVGRDDMLFDPASASELAQRMQRVLTDAAFASELSSFGLARVQKFRAEAVSQATLEAFERRGPRAVRNCVTTPLQPAYATGSTSAATQPEWSSLKDRLNASGYLLMHANAREAAHSDEENARLVHVFDVKATEETRERARQRPGIILLHAHDPVATPEQIRAGTYLGAGYAGLLEADANHHDPMSALVPLLQEAFGVVTESTALTGRVRSLLRANTAPELPIMPFDANADLDTWFANSHAWRESQLVGDISKIAGRGNDDDLAQIAYGASASRVPATRRWFVDVTRIAMQDLGTGVHRVVRSVLEHWLRTPPRGIRIEPVRFEDGNYRYARRYSTELLQLDELHLAEGIVQPRHGDTFVGLDWAPESLSAAATRIADWRRDGVRTAFVVHDLLPVRLPDCFHAYSRDLNERWLRDMSRLADRVVCVSNATAQDYRAWLEEAARAFQFQRPPDVCTFALGVDPAVIGGDTDDLRQTLRAAVLQRPTLLMVGTLEPRKGHRDALDVADRLWRSGVEFNLVIVGRRGWMVDDVIARMERHLHKGSMLHWHDDVSDRELGALYRHSSALLAASLGEGYGLPLIEAAQHGLPVVARDIAVFREVMGTAATYLPHDAGHWDELLASQLAMTRVAAAARRWPTWAESAAKLADAVAGAPEGE